MNWDARKEYKVGERVQVIWGDGWIHTTIIGYVLDGMGDWLPCVRAYGLNIGLGSGLIRKAK